MQELAAAIGAAVAQVGEAHAADAADAPAGAGPLAELTQGLYYVSESEAPLEAVSLPAPAGPLTDAAVAQLAGQPVGTPVEKQELTYFLRNHTADNGVLGNPELANRFKALQMYLKQELEGVQVYRFGQGPQVPVYVLGKTADGQLAGFKTVLTET
ncbi:nuclease A inhibitor family protein [Hymenobacter weizhouensis]|nr:nuclease A inhibitor family protein [Hymenobacter sp. YIM 151500-1]